MKKPYYDPKTKETYIKCRSKLPNGITVECKMMTGFSKIVGNKTIWYNEFGEVLREESHVNAVRFI